MGITISSKRYGCDMGYGGFGRFRNIVAEKVNEKVYSHYSCLSETETMFLSGNKRDEFFDKYNAKTEELIIRPMSFTTLKHYYPQSLQTHYKTVEG